jgi:hypothetical protein
MRHEFLKTSQRSPRPCDEAGRLHLELKACWASDITHGHAWEGWLELASVMSLRRGSGWVSSEGPADRVEAGRPATSTDVAVMTGISRATIYRSPNLESTGQRTPCPEGRVARLQRPQRRGCPLAPPRWRPSLPASAPTMSGSVVSRASHDAVILRVAQGLPVDGLLLHPRERQFRERRGLRSGALLNLL